MVDEEPLSLSYINKRVQEFIKENDIIITETNELVQNIAQKKMPQSVCVESQSHYLTQGWATAAALGASLAKTSSRLILIEIGRAHV